MVWHDDGKDGGKKNENGRYKSVLQLRKRASDKKYVNNDSIGQDGDTVVLRV
jgi:hypothetical protein